MRYYINKTVDGTILSTVLKGLLPGVLYQVEVAAVTSAGVGAHSQPVSVLISKSCPLPQLPRLLDHPLEGFNKEYFIMPVSSLCS